MVARIVAPSGADCGGEGACLEASITLNLSVSQNQPTCNTNNATHLIDCGNWGVCSNLDVRLGNPATDAVPIARPALTRVKWVSPGWRERHIEFSTFMRMNDGSD
jgi:hypothetical protein